MLYRFVSGQIRPFLGRLKISAILLNYATFKGDFFMYFSWTKYSKFVPSLHHKVPNKIDKNSTFLNLNRLKHKKIISFARASAFFL